MPNVTTPSAPPAIGTTSVPASTTSARSATRGDRSAFERALSRQAARPGNEAAVRHGTGQQALSVNQDERSESVEALVEREDRERDGDHLDERARSHREPGLSTLNGDPAASAPTGHQGGAGDDRERRRWLHEVLESLDAADEHAAVRGRPRNGLEIGALVPGLGPVRLRLSWPDGALRVSLHGNGASTGAAGGDDNPHVQSPRQAGRLLKFGAAPPGRQFSNALRAGPAACAATGPDAGSAHEGCRRHRLRPSMRTPPVPLEVHC